MNCAFRPFRVHFFGVCLGFALALISPAASAQLEPNGEVVVSTAVRDPYPGLAPLVDGGTVLTWVDQVEGDGEFVEILRGRWLNPDLSTRVEVSIAEAHGRELALLLCPQVTRIGLGRVVFAWLEVTPGVRRAAFRVVDGDGTPRTEILHPYPPQAEQDDECPRLRGRDQGFVIAWSSRSLGVRKFSNDGVPTSPPITLGRPADSAPPPALAIDRDGGFAAAWVGQPTPTSRPTLVLRRFARDGKALGRAIPITDSEVLRVELVESGWGFELIWNRRFTNGRTSIREQRFGRDFLVRSAVRTVLQSDFAVLSGATVDRFGRTILTYHEDRQVRGLVVGRRHSLCGPASRLNAAAPWGDFPVAAASVPDVVVAGVETSDDGTTSRLVARRYTTANCGVP